MTHPPGDRKAVKAQSLIQQLAQELHALPPDARHQALGDLLDALGTGEAPLQFWRPACQDGISNLLGSSNWLEGSLSRMRAGVWCWNLLDGTLNWSAEMYRLHEFDPGPERIDFECLMDFIHPDDRPFIEARFRQSDLTGEPFDSEYRIITRKGRTLWVTTTAVTEYDDGGNPLFMGGVTRDITDRKSAQADLLRVKELEKANSAELTAILDAVPALIWISRDPECREMTGSRFGYEILGMGKGSNLSKTAPEPDRRLQHFRNFKNGVEIPHNELPMQIAASQGIGVSDYEFDLRFEDGHEVNLLGNVKPLLAPDGSPNGAVGAFVDITARKRIEAAQLEITESERQRAAMLQAVMDAVPTPIFLSLDPEGLVITGNRAAYQNIRMEPGTNLSRMISRQFSNPISRTYHNGQEIAPEQTPMYLAMRTGKPVEDYEARVVFNDGKEITMWGGANPLVDASGKVFGSVAAFVDVTSRIEAEETLRRSAERDSYRILLADSLRTLTDPDQIKTAAARVLGQHLGASRVIYCTIAPDGETVELEPGYADGVPMLTGRFRFSDFSRDLERDHPGNQPYIITDTSNDPRLTDEQRAAYMTVKVRSHLDVPLVFQGRIAALLSLEQSTPRQWTADEIDLAVETAERTWAAVERAHAEMALRESESRFHASIDSLLESFVVYSAVREARTDGRPGKLLDLRFEYVNAAACRINALSREDMLGRNLLEVLPAAHGRELFKRYSRVIRTGEPLMERVTLGGAPETARIFDIHAVKMGDGLVVTRADVTEQVRVATERQQALTQMELHRRLTEQSDKDRQSYARELHDGPIQNLASISYSLQYIKETFPDPVLRLELEQIGSVVRGTIQELRQVISELRPPSVLQMGLMRAIQLHSEGIMDNGSSIRWQYRLAENDKPLPFTLVLALFRIYQEAANNIIRHSEATRAWVNCQIRSDRIVLEVRDNGKGLPPRVNLDRLMLDNHFGLAGMTERAAVIGGRIDISSKPGEGTRIRVTAPLPAGSVPEVSLL